MSLDNTRNHNGSDTILIETKQITSNLEKANGRPGLKCFITTVWDLRHDRPIDQRLSYGGNLAKATIRSPQMLSKFFCGSNNSSNRHHLIREYLHHGVRLEVSAIRNGCVWLRPIGSLPPTDNVVSRDAPPADQPLVEHQAAVPASARLSAEQGEGQFMPESCASLARQPIDIQHLVGYCAEKMFYGTHMAKAELSRRMQVQIQMINLSRSSSDQLKIPSRKMLCLFIDEYLNYALSQGLADRQSILKNFAGVDREPFDQQASHTAEQSPPEIDE